MSLNLKICRDVWGCWSVRGLAPLPAAHFPSLSASLDYARKECAAAPATIELLIDGFYVVIHQERGWPRRIVGAETDQPQPAAMGPDFHSPPPIWSRFLARLKNCGGRSVAYPSTRSGNLAEDQSEITSGALSLLS
jgi:hypothetical protein